jgi:predicted N-acetyltransferase YhbS
MNIELYNFDKNDGVVEFFKNVFSTSENREEGEIIAKLVQEMQTTTPSEDIFGCIAINEALPIEKSIVGCVFFTRLDFKNTIQAFILSPMAIATRYQKQGIGQTLINFGLEYAKTQHIDLVLTYGDIAFYKKVGFAHISESVIPAPFTLSYPDGWLAQHIKGENIKKITTKPRCVAALQHQNYW